MIAWVFIFYEGTLSITGITVGNETDDLSSNFGRG